MITCPYCKKEYDDNLEYCPYCGGDNPDLDGFKKHEDEYVSSSEEKQPITISSNIAKRKVLFYNYRATIEYDLDDDYENEQYHMATKRTKILTIASCIYFAVAILLIVFFIKKDWWYVAPYVGVFTFPAWTAITYVVLFKGKKNDIIYIKHMVERRGGDVRCFDGDLGFIEYDLNGERHKLEIPRSRYHRPINY